MKKLNYILVGTAGSFAVFLIALYYLNSSGILSINTQKTITDNNFGASAYGNLDYLTQKDTIIKKSNIAFGKIFNADSQNENASANRGGGVEKPMASAVTPTSDSMISSSPKLSTESSTSMIRMYNPKYYSYKYSGSKDDLKVSDQIDVLKRVKGASINYYNGIPNSILDASKFSDAKYNNITIDEDRDRGYTLSLNLQYSNFSIYKNYTKWPNDYINFTCKPDEKCIDPNIIKIDQVPLDAELVSIAKSFIQKYSINTSNYGEPIIQNDWRFYYNKSQDKENYYVPQSISVLFPLKINDKYVYETYGTPTGLTISIDIKNKVVDSMNGFTDQNYESSNYDMETDLDKLSKIMETGGMDYSYYQKNDQNIEQISVDLEKPTIGYTKYYRYTDGNNEEFLVPALIFKVNKLPDNSDIYKENIVVPLVKEFVNEMQNRPIPIMMKALDDAKTTNLSSPTSYGYASPVEIKKK